MRRLIPALLFLVLAIPSAAPAQMAVDFNIADPPSVRARGHALIDQPAAGNEQDTDFSPSPLGEAMGALLPYNRGRTDGLYDFQVRAYALSPCQNYDATHPIQHAIMTVLQDEWSDHARTYANISDVPPEYRDQYRATGAQPVQRVFTPVFSRITSQSYEVEQADSDVCDNRDGMQPITCTVNLTGTTTDTLTVTTVDQNAYNAAVDSNTQVRVGTSNNFVGVTEGVNLHFGYTKTQSTSSAVTHTHTRTHAETVSVEVPPGEATMVEMVVQQGTIAGEVHYNQTWQGDLVLHCPQNGTMRVHPIYSLFDGDLGRRWTAERAAHGDLWEGGIDINSFTGPEQIDNNAYVDTFHIDAHTRVSTTNKPVREGELIGQQPPSLSDSVSFSNSSYSNGSPALTVYTDRDPLIVRCLRGEAGAAEICLRDSAAMVPRPEDWAELRRKAYVGPGPHYQR